MGEQAMGAAGQSQILRPQAFPWDRDKENPHRKEDRQASNTLVTDILLQIVKEEFSKSQKHGTTWMNIEDMMLREISQSQKDKSCMIPLNVIYLK